MNAIEDIIKETKKNSSLSDVSAIALSKREKGVLYRRQYYLANKESIDKRNRQYRLDNKESIAEKGKQYHLDNKESKNKKTRQYRLDNKESISKQKNKYYLANKEKRSLYRKKRLRTDPLFRLVLNLRSRLYVALNGNFKSASTMKLLGCSIEFLKQHLQKQFKPGMSWKNRGSFHIDHIKPCASFDLNKPEEQKRCFNYTNLQPLFPIDNLRKGARY